MTDTEMLKKTEVYRAALKDGAELKAKIKAGDISPETEHAYIKALETQNAELVALSRDEKLFSLFMDDPAIQQEFKTPGAFIAYKKAEAAGRI